MLTQSYAYIVDAIDATGYDKEPQTIADKLQFLRDIFNTEYGWHVAQVGERKALASWLAGLPSSCNIEWRNHAILELGQRWGELSQTCSKAREDAYLYHWFSNTAARIQNLWRQFNTNRGSN